MKTKIITALAALVFALNLSFGVYAGADNETGGKIYLYGEEHGVDEFYRQEFELWEGYYHDEGMRHLFIENPYYTAEYLNMWMKADNDRILDELYRDWEGTAGQVPGKKDFFKKIKTECPETIFHGTDVGHQYDTIGARYIKYLEANGLTHTKQYVRAKACVKQGEFYYRDLNNPRGLNDKYRENAMTQNFIREFEELDGQNIMGIYGGAHVGLDATAYHSDTLPCMGAQLYERYDNAVNSWRLRRPPIEVTTMTINEKEYTANYFGEEDLSALSEDYTNRKFWRLENAYDDFKNTPTIGFLPYNNYPDETEVMKGDVFIIDYTLKKDGSIERHYLRDDGNKWNGRQTTEAFLID